MEDNLNKEKVWYHLLNFSKTKWLGSDYFHLNLVEYVDLTTPEAQKRLEKTQRELAKIIGLLIADLKLLKDKRRIISSDKGYKIAATPEEVEQGWKYLLSKIEDPLKRINWLKEGYNEMVHKAGDKKIEDIFAQTGA